MSSIKELNRIQDYVQALLSDVGSNVGADLKTIKEGNEFIFKIYYNPMIDRVVKICDSYAYHELEGGWVFLTSNAQSLLNTGKLLKVTKFL